MPQEDAMQLKGSRTEKNVFTAFAGKSQARNRYTYFAAKAREEGFEPVARAFDAVSVAEQQHEKRYNGLAANVEHGRVFKREGAVVWRCRNCGYLHEGPEAPGVCPACLLKQAYFELLGENW
jgi:rubrerythrin